jgi:hypothetical protein
MPGGGDLAASERFWRRVSCNNPCFFFFVFSGSEACPLPVMKKGRNRWIACQLGVVEKRQQQRRQRKRITRRPRGCRRMTCRKTRQTVPTGGG